MSFRKDRSLDELARVVTSPSSSASRLRAAAPYSNLAASQDTDRIYVPTNREAIASLLSASPDGTINLRSFTPDSPRSRDFHYGIGDVDEAYTLVERLSADGLFVIANETVDVSDGGVSGVVQGA